MEAIGQLAAAVKNSAQQQRAIVVVGAGRSGTSAIMRGVQVLGVELGDKLRRGWGKNPTGFFEDRDLLRIYRRLKRLLGIRGQSVTLIDAECWQRPEVQALRDEAIATIRRRFGKYPLWGYKHGRTLRLLPFWASVYQALELDVSYIVAVRNPLSVTHSRGRLDPRRGVPEQSDLEWLVNVVPYFRQMAERPFVVVDFDLIMSDPVCQLERIARTLNLPLGPEGRAAIEAYRSEFLRPRMRHSLFSIEDLRVDSRVNHLVRDAYGWLDQLATDTIQPDDPAFWQDWRRIEAAVQELAPLLRHVDRLEAELGRAQRHPAGPLQALPRLWRKLRYG